ncbi:MAG TPA: N-(5'-phosphoribosyl)anthranilate isomerase [Rhodobacteraceae bacterium]|jgi:hypothetical protein|nr:N-(5'-phosphoribosyl)anthranilate isomerase [Paracoccaceae bacterium]
MSMLSPHLESDRWMLQLFSSRTAREGGVVRRRKRDIERLIGMERFRRELRRRGFRAVENAGHVIVFCNSEPVDILT